MNVVLALGCVVLVMGLTLLVALVFLFTRGLPDDGRPDPPER